MLGECIPERLQDRDIAGRLINRELESVAQPGESADIPRQEELRRQRVPLPRGIVDLRSSFHAARVRLSRAE